MIKTHNSIQLRKSILLIIILWVAILNINAQSQSIYYDCDCDSLNIEYRGDILLLFSADQIGLVSFGFLPPDTLEWVDNEKKKKPN